MAEEVWKIIYQEQYTAPPPPPGGGTAGAGATTGRPIPPPYDYRWVGKPPRPPPEERPTKPKTDPLVESVFKMMGSMGLGSAASFAKAWMPFFRTTGTRGGRSVFDLPNMAGAFHGTRPRPGGVGSAEEAAGFEGGFGGGGMFGGDFEGMASAYRQYGWRVGRTTPQGGGKGASDAIQEIGNTNRGQLKEALKIGALFTGIAGSITFLVSLLKRSKIFSTFMDSFLTILGAIVDIMLIPLIPFFSSVLKGMGKSIPMFIELSQMLGSAIGVLLSGSWLQDLLDPLIQLMEWIPKIFTEVVKFFSNPIQWVSDLFTNVFSGMFGAEGVAGWGGKILGWIWDGMVLSYNEVVEWGGRIIGWIWDGLVIAYNTVLEWGGKIIGWIWDGLVAAYNAVLEWGGKILGWIWDGLVIATNTVVGWGKAVLDWIWNGMINTISTVKKWGEIVLGWIWWGMVEAVETVYGWGKGIVQWIWEGIKTVAETVKGWGKSIITWIGETIGGMIDTIKGWGGTVISWFVTGIESAIDTVKSVARKIIDTFVDVWNETIGRIPGLHLTQGGGGGVSGVGAEGYKEGWDQLFGGTPSAPSKVEWYEVFNDKYWDEYLKPALGDLVGALGDLSSDLTYAATSPIDSLFNLGSTTASASAEMSDVGNTIGTQVDPALLSAANAANNAASNITSASSALVSKMNGVSVTTSNAWNQLTAAQQQDINSAVFMGGLGAPSAILGGTYNPIPAPTVYTGVPTDLNAYQSSAYSKLLLGGGYQHGSPFIPKDMMAYIHRGEAVIPEALNRIFAPFGGALNALREMASGRIEKRTAMQPEQTRTASQSRHLSIHNTFNITRTPDRELPTQLVESMEEQLVNAWQRIF